MFFLYQYIIFLFEHQYTFNELKEIFGCYTLSYHLVYFFLHEECLLLRLRVQHLPQHCRHQLWEALLHLLDLLNGLIAQVDVRRHWLILLLGRKVVMIECLIWFRLVGVWEVFLLLEVIHEIVLEIVRMMRRRMSIQNRVVPLVEELL